MSDNHDAEEKLAQYNMKESKLTKWANEPTVRELKQDLTDARSDADKHISEVTGWLDNLHITGSAKLKLPKGKSSLQPKLIRKNNEWRYAALSEPFLNTPELFDVSPVTAEDKLSAQQNQLVLNNQFNCKINKIKFIDDYVRTGVDEGTIVVRVGWESEEREVTSMQPIFEIVPAQSQEQVAELQNMAQSGAISSFPEWEQALALSNQSQIPMVPVQVGEEEVTETKVIKNQPTVEVCHYKRAIFDPTCEGDLDKAGFGIFEFESSIAELEADGKYSNLDMIVPDDASIFNSEDDDIDHGAFQFKQEPRKKFLVYEYWGYWDINNDGTLVPIVAAWVGNTLIRMEENPYPDGKLPFVVVQYLPVRKSLFGEPEGSLIEDNQKVVGALTRGMVDVMGRSANGQLAIRKGALDFTNKRKFDRGQDFEFNGNIDPRQIFHMNQYPELSQSAPLMLQMQQAEAESMTGARAFGATNTKGIGDSATAARDVMDAASKREVNILRRLAKGIEDIGRKILAMNAEFLSEEEIVRVTNDNFVKIRRDDLAGNYDLRLSISTAEEDDKKAQELAFMLQTMGNNMESDMSRMILAENARLRRMPALAKRIEEYSPQPDPIQQQMAQLEIQKLQMEIAKLQSETQENYANAALDQAKAGTEQAKAANLSSDTDLKDLDFLEQESGVKQAREMERQGAQANANANLKLLDAALDKENPLVGGFAPTPKEPSQVSDPTVSNGLEPV